MSVKLRLPHAALRVKAGAQWIQYLLSLVPGCPWQHMVFTLPCQYWSLVFHNRWLLAGMSRIAADVIQEISHQADVEPGIFTVFHTWGSVLWLLPEKAPGANEPSGALCRSG